MNKIIKSISSRWEDIKTYCSNNKFIIFMFFLIILTIFAIITLPFWYNLIIVKYFSIDEVDSSRLKIITIFNYIIGMLLLIIQIRISNKRATAAENTAQSTVKGNLDILYQNAKNDLINTNPIIRISAISHLYNISQNTNIYNTIIVDMFCASLRMGNINSMSKEERQSIIDKLFRVTINKNILKNTQKTDLTDADLTDTNLTNANLTETDLTGTNLTDANLTGANLTGANLTGADVINTDLTGANLTNIKVQYAWNGWSKIKSLKNATLDGIEFGSKVDLSGKNLQNTSLINTTMKYIKLINADLTNANLTNANLTGTDLTNANLTNTNLTDADLTGTDLTGIKGLTFKQLSKVKCLYKTKGLNQEMAYKLKTEKPTLFEPLKQKAI